MPTAKPMAGTDLISALPLEIKVSILCCLKVKDAVRMSALARSWRHLWTLLPCLRLDRRIDPLRPTRVYPVPSDCVKRVYYIVSSLRGPLLIFEIAHNFSANQSTLLEGLLHLLLQKGGVQTLRFSSYLDRVVLRLPSFQSLKVLQLSKCHVVLPTGFQGFNSLSTLALIDVKISNGDFHLLNNTSNNLTRIRYFNLVASEGPLSVNINLPLLRHLEFEINVAVDKVCVISAPCLEQAHILIRKLTDSTLAMLAWVNLGLVTRVAMVSSLCLDYGVLEVSFI